MSCTDLTPEIVEGRQEGLSTRQADNAPSSRIQRLRHQASCVGSGSARFQSQYRTIGLDTPSREGLVSKRNTRKSPLRTVHDSYESSSFNETLSSLSRSTTGMTYRVNSEALLTEVQSSVQISINLQSTGLTDIGSISKI